MLKKIKKVINTKIFCFILGALIFGTIGVSAATYFESNLVTYDNTESGLNSTNVQGAIDELYNMCFPPAPPLGDEILEKVPIVTEGDGLYKDEYEEGRYFFKGGNPNNYITFNGESWRIISVEQDKTIKIMRTESVGEQKFDTDHSNNWANPTSLNTYLNGTYYNGLNNEAKSQIVASNFSIAGVSSSYNSMSTQVSEENSNKWYGNIALPTISEYIRTNSNKSSCGTWSLINDNANSCVSTGWMDNNNAWWTLTPSSGNYLYGYLVSWSGAITVQRVDLTAYAVHPVLYLSSEVKITRGDGSQNNPYRIE